MKPMFTFTAEHRIPGADGFVDLNGLPDLISQHTDWNYSCQQTDTGCVLMPVLRRMPYCNSFVPEIEVTVSRDGPDTVLHMRGRPVPMIRVFVALWLGAVSLFEIAFLAFVFASGLESLPLLLVPAGMWIYGFLLCKIGTKATFRSVTAAIGKMTLP